MQQDTLECSFEQGACVYVLLLWAVAAALPMLSIHCT